MPFSSDARRRQREQAVEWIDTHWTRSHDCPICGTDSWNTGDIVVMPMADSPLTEPVAAVIPLTCRACGYTRLFDAVVMGILEGTTEPLT